MDKCTKLKDFTRTNGQETSGGVYGWEKLSTRGRVFGITRLGRLITYQKVEENSRLTTPIILQGPWLPKSGQESKEKASQTGYGIVILCPETT